MEHLAETFVSVIIPVYNDAEYLKTCLEALDAQTYPHDLYEIIVVDNGSPDLDQVKEVVAPFKNVILAHESTTGSYAARNRGLSLVKEVIAFTDADCIPATDWLETGVKILSTVPNCGLVAGQIQMFFSNPERPTVVELYESILGLPQKMFLEQYHYGATANLFTTRQVVEKVGKFDSSLKSSGDLEWGQRVYAQGYRQVYTELALVKHPTHTSFPEFFRRTKRLAGGHYDLRLKQAQTFWQHQTVFFHILVENLIPPVFFTVNMLKDDHLKGIGQKLKVSFLMMLVRYISAWEILRLKLGGVSHRA
jgi:glycosyltransferase involved in cell wall biosynthesis